MFDFFTLAAIHFKKIKVMHSLPGRLRIKVPDLNKVDKDFRIYDEYMTKAIKLLPGIEDVSYNYISSNVLLCYDAKTICEKKILDWIETIWQTGIKNRKFIEQNAVNNIQYVIDNLMYQLNQELNNNPNFKNA